MDAETTAATKIGMPQMVFAKYDIDTLCQQQRHQPIRTIVAIGENDVALAQRRQQGAEQGRLAGLLAAIGSEGAVEHGSRCQAQERHPAQDGKADARPLRAGLRIGLLVGLRIRHRERRAIHQHDAFAVPTPVLGRLLFELLADIAGHKPQEHFGQLGPRLAIGAGAGIADLPALTRQPGQHPRHCRQARLRLRGRLRDESPQRYRQRIDVVRAGAKGEILQACGSLDLLLGQYFTETSVVILQEAAEKMRKRTTSDRVRCHKGLP